MNCEAIDWALSARVTACYSIRVQLYFRDLYKLPYAQRT
jgi:hypothetical protein